MITKIQEAAKFAVAILTVVVTAGVGLIPVEYVGWIQFAVAIIGAIGVYEVENKPAGDHAA